MFFGYLGLTLALEAPVYLLALRSRTPRERLVLWLIANAISYPPVFYFFPYLSLPPLACELLAEIWAPVCEIGVAWVLLPQLNRREMGWIVLANLVSWLPGRFLVRALF